MKHVSDILVQPDVSQNILNLLLRAKTVAILKTSKIAVNISITVF
jgi:hypothetical protein